LRAKRPQSPNKNDVKEEESWQDLPRKSGPGDGYDHSFENGMSRSDQPTRELKLLVDQDIILMMMEPFRGRRKTMLAGGLCKMPLKRHIKLTFQNYRRTSETF